MTWITPGTLPDRFRARVPAPLWQWVALGVVLLIAAFFDFFRLTSNGYGNLYYAASVKSMLTSWQNLFFVSFDPGGSTCSRRHIAGARAWHILLWQEWY